MIKIEDVNKRLQLNPELLEKMLIAGLIYKKKHPTLPLWIYNYVKNCQYEQIWNDATMMARGLILDTEGNIVARPFPKFFNLEELEGELPDLPHVITDKMDGSLIIVTKWKEHLIVSTRGSFETEQAEVAKKILESYPDSIKVINEGFTLLFEVIYPENQIVVNYNGETKLVLLTEICNDDGKDSDRESLEIIYPDFELVQQFYASNVIELREKFPRDNSEGFVIQYSNGFRVKLKYAEYVRLHRFVSGLNARVIWEWLTEGKDPMQMSKELELPEEFETWIKERTDEFNTQYQFIVLACDNIIHQNNLKDRSRKDAALIIMKMYKDKASVIFKMLDDQDFTQTLWRLIKPKGSIPIIFNKEDK